MHVSIFFQEQAQEADRLRQGTPTNASAILPGGESIGSRVSDMEPFKAERDVYNTNGQGGSKLNEAVSSLGQKPIEPPSPTSSYASSSQQLIPPDAAVRALKKSDSTTSCQSFL